MAKEDCLTKNQMIRKWLRTNGGLVKLDFKNKDVVFVDGSLFSFRKEIIRQPKVLGYQQLPNGQYCEVYSKKKFPLEKNSGSLWFGEIDSAIVFFQELKKLLNFIGYETSTLSSKDKDKDK